MVNFHNAMQSYCTGVFIHDIDCSYADMEAKDNDHYTPLLTAAEFGQKEAFECLMSKGDGDKMIAALSKDQKSALFLAAESNHPELVKVSWYDSNYSLSCVDPFVNF